MSRDPHMLKSNSFRAQDIHIHQDLLCTAPSALSRKRERKPGTELQKERKTNPATQVAFYVTQT